MYLKLYLALLLILAVNVLARKTLNVKGVPMRLYVSFFLSSVLTMGLGFVAFTNPTDAVSHTLVFNKEQCGLLTGAGLAWILALSTPIYGAIEAKQK